MRKNDFPSKFAHYTERAFYFSGVFVEYAIITYVIFCFLFGIAVGIVAVLRIIFNI